MALISNHATLNEEVDPRLIIDRLRKENARLKAEIAMLRGQTGGDADEELPEYEKERIKRAVDEYINDSAPDSGINYTDYRKIQECYRIMKVPFGLIQKVARVADFCDDRDISTMHHRHQHLRRRNRLRVPLLHLHLHRQ